MAAKYEGHSDDDVVFLFLFFFQRDIITSPGYRGRNQDCDEDEGKLMAVKSSTVTACVLYIQALWARKWQVRTYNTQGADVVRETRRDSEEV